jgi:hypothetical protein
MDGISKVREQINATHLRAWVITVIKQTTHLTQDITPHEAIDLLSVMYDICTNHLN